MKLLAMIVAGCLACGAASAADVVRMAPTAPQDAATLAAITEASQRGLILFDLHRAQTLADAVMKKALKPDRQSVIAGSIVEPQTAGDLVTYYGQRGGVPYPIFTARVASGKVINAEEVAVASPPPLSPGELRMIAARQAAMDTGLSSCTKAAFEVIVFPLVSPDRTEVYLLTPKVNATVYPLGGHYKLTIDAAGKVADTHPFSDKCNNAENNGGGASGVVMRDPTLDMPNEIHAYLSLTTNLEITLWTKGNALWIIKGSQIQKMASAKP